MTFLTDSTPHWVECRTEAADHLSSSFVVSRNLKSGKYHFIEAKIYKLTVTEESSDTIPNSVSRSTWLCVIFNIQSTSHKTWHAWLTFQTFQNLIPETKKWGYMAYYIPSPEKMGGTRPLCLPPNCTHEYTWYKSEYQKVNFSETSPVYDKQHNFQFVLAAAYVLICSISLEFICFSVSLPWLFSLWAFHMYYMCYMM